MDDAKISDGASTAAWTMGEISSADWAIDPTSKSTSDGSALLQQAAASGLSLAGTTASALADTITLHLSEYAQQGNAQVLISVDGTPLDGVQTIVAQRALGLSQTLTLLGSFGTGPHVVSVQFLKNAWDGAASKDRNLYVDGIEFDGTPVQGAAATLSSGSTWTHILPVAITSVTSALITTDLAAETTLAAVSDAVPAVSTSFGTTRGVSKTWGATPRAGLPGGQIARPALRP